MDAIVLVKYVADIEHIPPDAWDLETGTLRRNRLRMVANPLDDRALAAARDITSHSGGLLTVVSMGPRSAERACRRALAYGADRAVLLSDASFAGADTLATARALAAAIGRLLADGGSSPVILAGMQSPDGDTAQVPAGVATLLGMPLVPYVTALEFSDGRLLIESLARRGRYRIAADRLPFVATMTGLAPSVPFHTSLAGLRHGAGESLTVWRAADLGLPSSAVGLEGSATRVVRIDSVPQRAGRGWTVDPDLADDRRVAVGELVAALIADLGRPSNRAIAASPEPGDDRGSPAGPTGDRSGPEIWVVVERDGEELSSAGLELLGEARRLADDLGAHATAVLCGASLREGEAPLLAVRGATMVRIVRESDERGSAEAGTRTGDGALAHQKLASLLAAAARASNPRSILIPATLRGRTVSAIAAVLLQTGLTADCTGLALESEAESAVAPGLLQTRPALGGNILATIVTTVRDGEHPEMATVRSGVFAERAYDTRGLSVPIVELTMGDAELDGFRETWPRDGWFVPVAASGDREPGRSASAGEEAGVDANAEVIVAVGAGIGTAENVERLVRPLQAAFARILGRTVSIACSRAAVDAGILSYEYQIGQTGKSVRPQLYVAIGISGAIQHRLGMEHSARVLSVNPDPDAPIHSVSDWSIVATAQAAVPLLLEALRA